jgi:serine/threonine protein kinase
MSSSSSPLSALAAAAASGELSAAIATDERAEILLFGCLNLPAADRAAFLIKECGADEVLRAEVEALLQDHERAGAFLQIDAPAPPEIEKELLRLKPECPGERIGSYKLLQQIGEGGFGVVWMAEQERPIRRRVALKIIKLGMDTKEVVARFEQERQALALMEHPNIARVFDAGATEWGRPFFVMELVRGIRITDYCDQENLSLPDRPKLFVQVCSAIQHAHQKGIIHRDLKPSNVLITLHDGVPVPKVIDFGIAKATQQQRLTDLTLFTQFEQMVGTPLYMAPEQAEMSGLDVDTRSDIYSLGVLLYELLTGRTPFDPERLMKAGHEEMRRVIREEEPPKPSTFVSTIALDLRTNVAKHRSSEGGRLISSIKGDLDWIVMKALEKDRNRRYETANGLAKDIERHLQNKPVQARPASASYRARRFVRRNKVMVGAGAVVLVVFATGVAGVVWQGLRANAALDRLRSSAPAFAAQAQGLVAKEEFAQALEKLETASALAPDEPQYLLAKANLLQSQLRLQEAARAYRAVLKLDSANSRARSNGELCERLARESTIKSKLSRESLVELLSTMQRETRPAAEMMGVSRLLGQENGLILSYWMDRLKDLPITPEKPLQDRLTVTPQGEISLDLSGTEITDLRPLEGMPLGLLNLTNCDRIRDFTPLRQMPLRVLDLNGTEVVDLSPIGTLKSLSKLSLSKTKVQDLSPLKILPLESLNISHSRVADLSPLAGKRLHTLEAKQTPVVELTPLAGMPLKRLELERTKVASLSPIAGMPLEWLDCSHIPARDFSPLATLKLAYLNLDGTAIEDLSILKHMPLKELSIYFCLEARSFKALQEIPTLETLSVHKITLVSDEDFTAFAALRDHPKLRFISADLHDGSLPLLEKERFWELFNVWADGREINRRAESLCRAGAYAEAADLLGKYIEETRPPYMHRTGLGLALAASGHDNYRVLCREMVEHLWRRLEGDAVAVRLCVVKADSGVSVDELRRVAPHMALVSETTIYRCWFALTNGLLEYRAGRLQEAIDLLSSVKTDRFDSALAAASAGLAMVNHRTGDTERAKAHLKHARAMIEPLWPGGASAHENWTDLFFAFLLVEEAEELLGSGQ